jgi:hypothetical protein
MEAHLCDRGEALEEEEQGAVIVGQDPPLVHQLTRHTPRPHDVRHTLHDVKHT